MLDDFRRAAYRAHGRASHPVPWQRYYVVTKVGEDEFVVTTVLHDRSSPPIPLKSQFSPELPTRFFKSVGMDLNEFDGVYCRYRPYGATQSERMRLAVPA